MDGDMDMTHPERHAVRTLKRVAEEALACAFRQALTLAYTAADLASLVDKVRADEAKRAAEALGPNVRVDLETTR
jgi:hypothetical protein